MIKGADNGAVVEGRWTLADFAARYERVTEIPRAARRMLSRDEVLQLVGTCDRSWLMLLVAMLVVDFLVIVAGYLFVSSRSATPVGVWAFMFLVGVVGFLILWWFSISQVVLITNRRVILTRRTDWGWRTTNEEIDARAIRYVVEKRRRLWPVSLTLFELELDSGETKKIGALEFCRVGF